MPAYIIAEITVHDWETFDAYRARAPEVIAAYGGRYLVRGGDIETLEGSRTPERLVILEFPDRDQARRFYTSDDYKKLIKLRQAAADTNLVLVEGIDGS